MVLRMERLILKLKNDQRLRNSLWMLIEKSISLFGLIFIVSAVAKYTGPDIYGEIALAASIVIVAKTIAQLGLDQVYFKYVSENKPYFDIFYRNAVKFISVIYFIIFLLVFLGAFFYASETGLYFILATGFAYYFNSIDLVNFFNEAKLVSKINVLANIAGLVIALGIRYFVVAMKLDVLYLCIPIIVMTVIPFFIKFQVYRKLYSKNSRRYEKLKLLKYISFFISAGIPLTFSILTVTFNSQIANYFLAYFGGTQKVAIYSVAFTLAGAWCIAPTTIIMSYLTTIYAEKDNKEYLDQARNLFLVILFMSLTIIVVLFFIADYVINFLYGMEYFEAIKIFKILLLYQLFWVIGFYFSRLIVKFNGYTFLAYKSIIVCILNLILAFYFIKEFGVIGAAYSVLIVEVISAFLINLFYQKANLLNVILFFRKKHET